MPKSPVRSPSPGRSPGPGIAPVNIPNSDSSSPPVPTTALASPVASPVTTPIGRVRSSNRPSSGLVANASVRLWIRASTTMPRLAPKSALTSILASRFSASDVASPARTVLTEVLRMALNSVKVVSSTSCITACATVFSKPESWGGVTTASGASAMALAPARATPLVR